MSDSAGEHTRAHDDLNRAFDTGSVFSAGADDLERYLSALGSLNIQNEPVRTKAVVRALTINHIQMSRVIHTLEATLLRLDAANAKTQRLVVILAVVAVAVGIVQCIIGLLAICT